MNLAKRNVDILVLFLSFTVALDALNGFFSLNEYVVFEQIIPVIRILALVWYVFFLARIDKLKFLKIFFVLVLFVSFAFIRIWISGFQYTFADVFEDGVYLSKALYFYILTNLMISLSEKELITLRQVKKIFRINAYLISLLIIVPTLFGTYRQTYAGSGFGSSGFFISNNATNISLIMLSLFLLYSLLFDALARKSNFLFYILILVTLFLQGSKTSLIVAIIELIAFIIYEIFSPIFKQKGISIRRLIISYFVICCTFAFFFLTAVYFYQIKSILLQHFDSLILRQKMLQQSSGSLTDTILSGRMELFQSLKSYYVNYVNFGTKVIGTGVAMLPDGMIVEMDPIDLFVRGGIGMIFITYGTAIFNLIKKRNKFNKDRTWNLFIQVLIFITIFYSVFAGHVFGEIIASTFISLAICSKYLRGDQN